MRRRDEVGTELCAEIELAAAALADRLAACDLASHGVGRRHDEAAPAVRKLADELRFSSTAWC